jgi:hypothetical protein
MTSLAAFDIPADLSHLEDQRTAGAPVNPTLPELSESPTSQGNSPEAPSLKQILQLTRLRLTVEVLLSRLDGATPSTSGLTRAARNTNALQTQVLQALPPGQAQELRLLAEPVAEPADLFEVTVALEVLLGWLNGLRTSMQTLALVEQSEQLRQAVRDGLLPPQALLSLVGTNAHVPAVQEQPEPAADSSQCCTRSADVTSDSPNTGMYL